MSDLIANKKDRGTLCSATELVCYLLDKSAGTEGFDYIPSVSGNGFGRYEIGLLCLGMMHFHFGHPKLALEVKKFSILILIRAQHSTFSNPQGFYNLYYFILH